MKLTIDIKTNKKDLTPIYIYTNDGAYCATCGEEATYDRGGIWCYTCSKYLKHDNGYSY